MRRRRLKSSRKPNIQDQVFPKKAQQVYTDYLLFYLGDPEEYDSGKNEKIVFW